MSRKGYQPAVEEGPRTGLPNEESLRRPTINGKWQGVKLAKSGKGAPVLHMNIGKSQVERHPTRSSMSTSRQQARKSSRGAFSKTSSSSWRCTSQIEDLKRSVFIVSTTDHGKANFRDPLQAGS
ncbi:hypothetical protein HS088_TW23G00377 [Tripterygium wilfordii]|uniref:Uncharacterized protein n=1 Tax=Tripterygium wilfordii TaxID=458696 RepID=A0A7J7BUT2_TRIWF|nr:hypothetical protein HS088_TW23G00377 [Tripterygium wilfordii]